MKKIVLQLLNCLLFLSLVAGMALAFSQFSKPDDVKSQLMLYDAVEEDSIDVIYIGSSAVYTFFDVMSIWETYGITSMSHGVSAMPFDFVIPYIQAAQTTQSPQLYVVELRSLMREEMYTHVFDAHYGTHQADVAINTLSYLPVSTSKLEAIGNSPYLQTGSYHHALDILFNHTVFLERVETKDEVEPLYYMGNQKLSYLTTDVSAEYQTLLETRQETVLPQSVTPQGQERLQELFQYAEQAGIQLCFTFSPYVSENETRDAAVRQGLVDYITENGYVCKDFNEDLLELDLAPASEFQDLYHVNAVGAKKYSLHTMAFLMENFDLTASQVSPAVAETWDAKLLGWLDYDDRHQSLMGIGKYYAD